MHLFFHVRQNALSLFHFPSFFQEFGFSHLLNRLDVFGVFFLLALQLVFHGANFKFVLIDHSILVFLVVFKVFYLFDQFVFPSNDSQFELANNVPKREFLFISLLFVLHDLVDDIDDAFILIVNELSYLILGEFVIVLEISKLVHNVPNLVNQLHSSLVIDLTNYSLLIQLYHKMKPNMHVLYFNSFYIPRLRYFVLRNNCFFSVCVLNNLVCPRTSRALGCLRRRNAFIFIL